MWHTAAEWHAAMNDLPAALLVASVLFDLLGDATRRDGLRVAGYWTLVAGTLGAVAAAISGLIAARAIEHGEAVHRVMERHQFLALSVAGLFLLLAGWRIWRRGALSPAERPSYLVAATVGALGVIWVAHLGGTIVFRHGGGIPTAVMREALQERDADSASGHEHAPGTPPHRHE